jgi:hypothetical protein
MGEIAVNDAERGLSWQHRDIVIGAGETLIATVPWNDFGGQSYSGYPTVATQAEQDANAALLIAAPDLLAALQAEEEWRGREEVGALDPEWDYELMVGDKRRAAIAKAEGRA